MDNVHKIVFSPFEARRRDSYPRNGKPVCVCVCVCVYALFDYYNYFIYHTYLRMLKENASATKLDNTVHCCLNTRSALLRSFSCVDLSTTTSIESSAGMSTGGLEQLGAGFEVLNVRAIRIRRTACLTLFGPVSI